MKVTAKRISPKRTLEFCSVDDALEARADTVNTYWIRIHRYQRDELSKWIGRLKLTKFARNRILRAGQTTKVVPVEQGVIVDLRVLPKMGSDAPRQISFVCFGNLLLELDAQAMSDGGNSDEVDPEFELIEMTPNGVLCSRLLEVVRDVSQEVRRIRSQVIELDSKMERDPTSVELDTILELKDRLLRTLAVADEQSVCCETLAAASIPGLDFTTLNGTLRLLNSIAGSAERMAERTEKRLVDLRHRYDAHQQEKLNHRLAVLTVISAIFLPLTLVAGIWGMNFEHMPELSLAYAYPGALTLMVMITLGLLWLFRKQGWFD